MADLLNLRVAIVYDGLAGMRGDNAY